MSKRVILNNKNEEVYIVCYAKSFNAINSATEKTMSKVLKDSEQEFDTVKEAEAFAKGLLYIQTKFNYACVEKLTLGSTEDGFGVIDCEIMSEFMAQDIKEEEPVQGVA